MIRAMWRRHARNQRPLVRMVFLVLAGLAPAASALAQSNTPPTKSAPAQPIFILGVEAKYGAPQRTAAGVALFLPMQQWHCGDGLCGGRGIEVQASTGAGGWRLAGGPVEMAFPIWLDLLISLTGTSDAPRGATADSTYLGVEAGFAFPVYAVRKRYVSVRPSIGIAHRVNGPAGPEETTFTWSIGAHVLWPKF